MHLFFDILILIGLVGTLLPLGLLLHHRYSPRSTSSWEKKHPRMTAWLSIGCLLAAGLLLYGSIIEPRFIVTNHVSIDLEGIDTPVKIGFVADFQVGPVKQEAYIMRIVDRLLSLDPDMVLIGGDHVDNTIGDRFEYRFLRPLATLTAHIPTYAIHGNHEYGINGGESLTNPHLRSGDVSDETRTYMESLGVQYLQNTVTTTPTLSQPLRLFGGDATWAGALSFKHLPESVLPTIGLIHNPAAAGKAAKHDIDLILSGHTHGGQIRLPFIGPVGRVDTIIPAAWYQGLHQVDDDTQLFVTSGTGESGTRARLFNPPEVVLITLH